MGDRSTIEWTDATWNPVTGCTKVSQGCKHCYAEREWPRLTKLVPSYIGRDFTDVRTHADRLDQPLRWKKPRRVFVNSMSDLFHDDVPFEFIDRVFSVMALAPQHTFQVLTKRTRRMREYMNSGGRAAEVFDLVRNSELGYWAGGNKLPPLSWPLPNVWLGASVEDRHAADVRIVELLATTAAVHWISAEPLLGAIDLWELAANSLHKIDGGPKIDWVVVGGESGQNARPMHPQWARDLRDQCAAEGVPFLFKQWGEWGNDGRIPMLVSIHEKSHFLTLDGKQWAGPSQCCPKGTAAMLRIGKKAAGRLLDGVLHDSYPGDLR